MDTNFIIAILLMVSLCIQVSHDVSSGLSDQARHKPACTATEAS